MFREREREKDKQSDRQTDRHRKIEIKITNKALRNRTKHEKEIHFAQVSAL